jgi:hypothetical protein
MNSAHVPVLYLVLDGLGAEGQLVELFRFPVNLKMFN